MPPITTNDTGRIVISKTAATILTLLIALATTAFTTGVRWNSAQNALDQEKRDRMVADSAIIRELAPIAKDVRAIKAKILNCANDALCQ